MTYNVEGKDYPVEIIRKNNKNTYIRVKEGKIFVTTNYFVTKKQILSILGNHEDFLEKMITKCQQKEQKQDKFIFLGKGYDIIIMPTECVEMYNQNIYIKNKDQLQKWVQKQRQSIFMKEYEACYQRFEEKIPFYRLRIRKMTTRWGVCNRKSETITLNSELLHYDLDVIDYVIIHELSHLVHFNHSKSFWNLVEKYCPNYKAIKKELKES